MSTNIIFSQEKLPKKLSGSSGLLRYLREIQKFPMLTAEEEYECGIKCKRDGDKRAAQTLVQSHLRLSAKMAIKFKKYGLPLSDLISEGNLGLIQAVKKFDPEKGFRFATYAMWWIRAYIQEYILRTWSLVKIGTTIAQKKLFFNLHKIKKKIGLASSDFTLQPEHVTRIADDLNVEEKNVLEMDSRLQNSDSSLNNLAYEDGDEVGNLIATSEKNQEQTTIERQEKSIREKLFYTAFAKLNDREKDILTKRRLQETPPTLEELSKIHNVSKERIRQIEENAIKKIKKNIIL
jgi:RNA polymerase sigma-32 factor